jgi:hypothetical protein
MTEDLIVLAKRKTTPQSALEKLIIAMRRFFFNLLIGDGNDL